MTERKNPIVRRLDWLSDQWTVFAELPDARLLCWRLRADEVSMVDVFFRKEESEQKELPDLFVRLRSPFDPAQPYGFALCGEFTKRAEEMQSALESNEKGPWKPPPWQREGDVTLFVRTCDSFSRHFGLSGHLAAVLEPAEIGDPAAFQLWLQRFAQEAPPHVRAIVLDNVEPPAFDSLARSEPKRVVATPADLDMPTARLELSRDAGNLDTPGGKFRHLFVQFSNALGEQNLPLALGFAQAALAIAAAQSWLALAVPIQMALGAAFAGQGRTNEANERYVQAELAAEGGEKAGDPLCTKIRPQARMARGGLMAQARAFGAAAKVFAETIPLAQAAGDPRMVLECYRLASFCHEQDGKYDLAWKFGIDGLGHAKTLDPATREAGNFPYLGEGLMRLTERPEYKPSSLRVEQEIVALAGRRDWRPGKPRSANQPSSTPT